MRHRGAPVMAWRAVRRRRKQLAWVNRLVSVAASATATIAPFRRLTSGRQGGLYGWLSLLIVDVAAPRRPAPRRRCRNHEASSRPRELIAVTASSDRKLEKNFQLLRVDDDIIFYGNSLELGPDFYRSILPSFSMEGSFSLVVWLSDRRDGDAYVLWVRFGNF